MLLCRIFNIHSVVPAAVFALVMDIITVDRPILRHPVAAAQAPEIGVVIIRYAGYLEQIHAPAEYLEQVNVLQESVSDLTIKTKDLKPFRFRL